MENEHSGPYFEERQIMLERNAEEAAKPQEVLVGELLPAEPQPAANQFTTREEVLDFIRQHRD